MISHEHKTIFIHIPKTAGQSIEQVFVDELGLSWENRDDLNLRYNDDPTFGPQQLSHLYADEYVKLGHISQNQWDEYFKFAIVRNPYDRILSEFRYRDVQATGPLFWFLRKQYRNDYSDMARHVVPQTRYLFDQKGNCLVDEIIKFEDLNARMPELFSQIFGSPRTLPKRNKSPSGKRYLTRNQLSKWNRMAIKRRFKDDFKILGYDPES